MDDERINKSSDHQMLWYALNFAKDDEKAYKENLDMADYMASFWNAEAVEKVREARDTRDDERFSDDKDFEQQILDKDFLKADDVIRTIQDKYKHTNLEGTNKQRERVVRVPKDMSGLFRTIKKE